MEELKDKGHGIIQKWEDNAKELINNFTQLFGPEGTLNSIWSTSTGRIKRALSPAPSPPESPTNGPGSSSSSTNGGNKKRQNGKKFAPNLEEEFSDEDEEEEEIYRDGQLAKSQKA